jgi:lipopolysaccharide biosynthesis regulator YciM
LEQYVNAMRSGALRTLTNTPSPDVAQKRAALAARIIEADLQTAQSYPDPQRAVSIARLHMDQYGNDLDAATRAMLEAEVELVSGDLASAQQHAASAVEVAPKSAASRYVLGLVEQHAGEWVLARNAWLEALEQDEDFIPARLALAREALRQGDAGGAEQYVVPAIREEPANLRGLCLYARVLLAQERLAAAKTIANRAVAVNKAAPEPRIILGEIALQQKDYAGSLLQFERALIQDPQSEDALDGLVRVYRRGEITRPMLRDLEKQAQSAPQSATLMELAGRLYADHGWSAGAKR